MITVCRYCKGNNVEKIIQKDKADEIFEKSVWFDGRRRARFSRWESYFRTSGEAVEYATQKAEKEIAQLEEKLSDLVKLVDYLNVADFEKGGEDV